ncbi:hypothetical protein I6N90_05275 [Paenibacillus sp. GSMTC-2017]|uniref:hypothetical protein n=1 Tax=Paenibacillus sp. GSMTC-2017 TaxID=2794350 RepID=UPI0018D8B1EE|nr:hypothetical protein [Paenibacillus sp. GSMTC-2017]MBH5317220.1 hypothetical protein [Paenibacillus sp. GSMTC-2017]
MNRYFFYHFLMVSLMNLLLFVPQILIQNRTTGAVASLLISPILGAIFIYMFTNAMARFPGIGLPEILKMFLPNWVVSPMMMFYAVMWWFSTTSVAVAYAVLINRFFNPDSNIMYILLGLILAAAYAASRSTLTVMLILEIGIIVNAPIVLFILFKMIRDPLLSMDAIRIIASYVTEMPTLSTLAAASFIFTGYINLSLFNRLFPPNFRIKHRWIYPFLGFSVLLMTFFIPIGFHGTEGVDNYIYLWTTTADSIAMQYGFIERVLFLFLIVFLNLTLLYMMVGFHVALDLVKCAWPKYKPEIDSPQTPIMNYVLLAIFTLGTLVYWYLSDEKLNFIITSNWMIVRFITEAVTVVGIFIISRRRRQL